jgi:hypothetical protein
MNGMWRITCPAGAHIKFSIHTFFRRRQVPQAILKELFRRFLRRVHLQPLAAGRLLTGMESRAQEGLTSVKLMNQPYVGVCGTDELVRGFEGVVDRSGPRVLSVKSS